MTDDDLNLLLRALEFAAEKHQGHRRKNGDIPYINHPIKVARLLREVGGVRDAATLAAAFLHDTVEDTETSLDELKREFGPRVAGIVEEVTDDLRLSKLARKRSQVARARELSREALEVKFADKLDNLRDLAQRPPSSWDRVRIRGYFCWAFDVIDAAAHVNMPLREALDELFSSQVTTSGEPFRAVPEAQESREELLSEYYRLMEGMR